MIVRRQNRAKKVPGGKPYLPKDISEQVQRETFERMDAANLKPHQLRKRELSQLHGILEKDIFVDPVNGLELYRTASGGWVTKIEHRGETV